jgi:hypothetical protein
MLGAERVCVQHEPVRLNLYIRWVHCCECLSGSFVSLTFFYFKLHVFEVEREEVSLGLGVGPACARGCCSNHLHIPVHADPQRLVGRW